MYQNIDDIDTPDSPPDARPKGPNGAPNDARFWLVFLVTVGFSVMFSAAIWQHSQKTPEYIHPSNQAEANAAFHKIQSEPRIAIRRARLIDYVASHPDSPVINAAKQQLRVMNDYEARDWSSLSDVMFSETRSEADKHFELNRYIEQWGEGLIGSRDEDLTLFKTELDATTSSPNIDRRHKPGASPIPESIDGSRMVGEQIFVSSIPSYPVYTDPIIEVFDLPEPEIVEPKIRKSKRPEYPRRAYSRGIPAIVEVSYNVDAKGRVVLVKVIQSEASRYKREFERAAKRAARATRYFPQTIDGIPTPVTGITKTYVFDPDI